MKRVEIKNNKIIKSPKPTWLTQTSFAKFIETTPFLLTSGPAVVKISLLPNISKTFTVCDWTSTIPLKNNGDEVICRLPRVGSGHWGFVHSWFGSLIEIPIWQLKNSCGWSAYLKTWDLKTKFTASVNSGHVIKGN